MALEVRARLARRTASGRPTGWSNATAPGTGTGRRARHARSAHPQAAQGATSRALSRLGPPRRTGGRRFKRRITRLSTHSVTSSSKRSAGRDLQGPAVAAVRRDRRTGQAFLGRPIEGGSPYVWLDATFVKVRRVGRIVSVAVIVAVGVNADRRRKVWGWPSAPPKQDLMDGVFARASPAGTPRRRAVVSDAHGAKSRHSQGVQRDLAALSGTAHRATPSPTPARAASASRTPPSSTPSSLRTRDTAKAQWRHGPTSFGQVPRLAGMMDDAEDDVLAFMRFPMGTGWRSRSTNRLEGVNAEIKRRTNVVGICERWRRIDRLVGAILLEQNDNGQTSAARYMTLEPWPPCAVPSRRRIAGSIVI